MSIKISSGAIGDIEAALIRCGFGRLDSAELSNGIINSADGVGFKTNKLAKFGIDPSRLVQELQSVGLIVHWTGAGGTSA
jgi:hypothetical protein